MTTDARPHRADRARRRGQVRLPGQLARLLVVEQQHVDALEQLHQLRALDVDPEVHRVAGDELRLLRLLEHAELQHRIDVGEEHVVGVGPAGGQLGAEVLKDVELGVERRARREVGRVDARPAERPAARHALEPRQVDAARLQQLRVRLGEVVADDARQADRRRRQERRGHGEVGRGAAQHLDALAGARLDGVERDGANDEQRRLVHGYPSHAAGVDGRAPRPRSHRAR